MNNPDLQTQSMVSHLKQLNTVRSQAHRLLDKALQNQTPYFSINLEKLEPLADFVIEVIKKNYPDGDIPYHSRWRHFETGGIDRLSSIRDIQQEKGELSWVKSAVELVIISVLLDAGAGSLWHFYEANHECYYTRSEGLALASLSLYQQGALSADQSDPFRVDAIKLISFNEEMINSAFQVSIDNPLLGMSGRMALLNQLGKCVKNNQMMFGEQGRLGDFYDYLYQISHDGILEANQLFSAVLEALSPIWPKRLFYEGYPLGDVWQHPSLKTESAGSDYLPFHKLSQWLTYSLLEPLEQSGMVVQQLDALTGLPEYRNGGLFLDFGVLQLKDEGLRQAIHTPSDTLIVEWRGLTVALLDKLAQVIRNRWGLSNASLPLAKILQGGTWDAGRLIAAQLRSGGVAPLEIKSDGTVF